MRLARADDAVWRQVPGGPIVALAADRDTPKLLGGTGCDVWTRLVAPIEFDELVATLARTYAADEATVRTDLEVAVRQLIDAGLVTSS